MHQEAFVLQMLNRATIILYGDLTCASYPFCEILFVGDLYNCEKNISKLHALSKILIYSLPQLADPLNHIADIKHQDEKLIVQKAKIRNNAYNRTLPFINKSSGNA